MIRRGESVVRPPGVPREELVLKLVRCHRI